jgi:peptidoglycan-N-acetylglucosamine deacetylase
MMGKKEMASFSPGFAQPPEAGCVYLTFDDGPDARWTPRILDILAQTNVRATFFVVGRCALGEAALVRRVAANGHELGNHTWSHCHPWTMLSPTARKEVQDGAAAIADLIGRAPKFFRPPHGRLRRCMIEEAERGGQTLVLWNRSAVDWGPLGSARGIAQRLGAAQAGDIVLMHDGGRGINRPDELVKVLPEFLSNLGRRGLVPSLLPE